MNSNSAAEHGSNGGTDGIPATPQPEAALVPHRIPLVPERSDFLDGDAPAADQVQAFLAQALDHIAKSAAKSRTSTRRLRWIEQRAIFALERFRTRV